MLIFQYSQSLGRFYIQCDETSERALLGVGYAGRGTGRNNPQQQHMKNVGPLPRGMYTIGFAEKHPRLGPLAYRLTPASTNVMFERSGFFIHGDNKTNDASQGCVVLPKPLREIVATSGISRLWVVQ